MQRSVVICNKKGLHARAAAKFVKCAQQFKADIEVCHEGGEHAVSAQSILGLMMLGAQPGSRLVLSGQGVDADPDHTDVLKGLGQKAAAYSVHLHLNLIHLVGLDPHAV